MFVPSVKILFLQECSISKYSIPQKWQFLFLYLFKWIAASHTTPGKLLLSFWFLLPEQPLVLSIKIILLESIIHWIYLVAIVI